MNNVIPFVAFNSPLSPCECCGKLDELRPYGAGGRWICFECGEQDPEGTEARAYEAMNEDY